MATFFIQQLDYIFFFYGLAFILLMAVCAIMHRRRDNDGLPWILLGLFGLIHGIYEWLDMLVISLGDSSMFSSIRLGIMLLSFMLLTEFGRRGLRCRTKRGLGLWIYLPLCACVAAGSSFGVQELTVAIRYSFGLVGGLMAALAIWRSAQSETSNRLLLYAAVIMALYTLAAGVIVPYAPFFPATVINYDTFMALAGLPIQLLRGVLAILFTATLWGYYQKNHTLMTNGKETTSEHMGKLLTAILISLLIAGWIGTQLFSREAMREVRLDILQLTQTATAAIDTRLVKTLSETPPNSISPDYLHVREHLLALHEANSQLHLIRLLVREGGQIITAADSVADGGPYHQEPGNIYQHPPQELLNLFISGKALTVGPYKNEIGTFVSGFAPLFDPVSGRTVAVLGIDVTADSWKTMQSKYRLLGIVMTLVFSILVTVFFIVLEKMRVSARKINNLAYYDSLTGLPNRLLFVDRLGQAIVLAERDQRKVALLFLDLDHFKKINDTIGHSYGDRLLKISADRILSCLRSSDTVARIGGDEFVVVLPMITSDKVVPKVARKILEMLKQTVNFEEHALYTSASIGVAMFPVDGTSVEDLLKSADIAMYQAKKMGRNNFQFFSAERNQRAILRQNLETSLQQAINRQEFYLEYQPQFDIRSRSIIGFEALIRWNHPHNGITSPGYFIPIAEETGLILSIGEWVLRTACRQAKTWLDLGNDCIRVAVNISALQFHQKDFVNLVREILAETGLPAQNLELELTESMVMDHADHNTLALKELKSFGIQLTLDDFGTGYSSLSYLKHFPIDCLKIDRSFITNIITDSDDAAIAEAIIMLAHSLKLRVIAEGVEREDQLNFLQSRNCDELQGFLMSHPLSAQDATNFLAASIKDASCQPPQTTSILPSSLLI